MEDTAAVWVALGTIMTGCAAVAAAIAAFMGLDSWKHQATWQQDRDLARRLLIALFVLRDRIAEVRNPFMFEGERTPDRSEAATKPLSPSEGTRLAYSRRWSRVVDARREVEALALEADAVWGNRLRELLTSLYSLNHELYNVISIYLDSVSNEDEEIRREFRTILRNKRNILYDTKDEEDIFKNDYLTALNSIEDYLRKKIGRGTN